MQGSQEWAFRPVLDWLNRNRRPLGAAFLSGFAMALVMLTIPNRYVSRARILPADSRGSGGSLAAAAALAGFSLPGQEGADGVYQDILGSDWLRGGLLASEFTFRLRTWYFGPEREVRMTLREYLRARSLDEGIRKVGGIMAINKDLRTKLLTITVETQSPQLSCQVVRKSTELLNTFLVEKLRTRGSLKARFAEQRLQEARADLDKRAAALEALLERNRGYPTNTDPQVRIGVAKLEGEMKLRQQLVATLAIAYEQALLDEKNDTPQLNVLDQGYVPINKSGPSRSPMVLLAMLVGGGLTWAWPRRGLLREKLASARRAVLLDE